ncbi:MAG: extracellular solute-binding protein [Pseudomonadota bacterium]
MARNYSEAFALYPAIAKGIETAPDRSAVHFTLDKRARFSDGSPVTADDVIWSLRTLGEEGHPRYRSAWAAVERVEESEPGRISVYFNTDNRELPLLIALRPILKRMEPWDTALDSDPLSPPIGSGPYVVEGFEPGRTVTFARVEDWWGDALVASAGINNPDRVTYEFFRSGDALWQAVAAGEIDLFSDGDPVRWATGYDIPSVRDGRVVRTELTHRRPSGMEGFVFNTRRAPLDDRRVREALGLLFDWAWINERVFAGQYKRITSYFGGSSLAFEGAASGIEADLLAPFAATLPDGTLQGIARWPRTAGTGRDRRALRRAGQLMDAAGYAVADGARRGADGTPLTLTVLVRDTRDETLAGLWQAALERLGVALDIRRVDAAQFTERRRRYDYDITVNRWPMSLSPGTEQRLYFGSSGREAEGTRNYAGIDDPAVDRLIDRLVAAEDVAAFEAAVRALDRVLTAGLYVVPFGVLPTDRIVHTARMRAPGTDSLYGWWAWWSGPGVWWIEEGAGQ